MKIPETRITGRTPECDGCNATRSTVKLNLYTFYIHLCHDCRESLRSIPDKGAS